MVLLIVSQWGSGGPEIAQQLAQRLDLPVWTSRDQEYSRQWIGQDCVVVGDCAHFSLEKNPNLMRVFIHCDMDTRIRRMMDRLGLTHDQAAREAMQQDRQQARWYGLETGKKWTDINEYDLTVHSEFLGISGTVELLCQFVALHTMRKRRGLYEER